MGVNFSSSFLKLILGFCRNSVHPAVPAGPKESPRKKQHYTRQNWKQ